jgi:uncharacterized Zn finger protein (UPF0148 family)
MMGSSERMHPMDISVDCKKCGKRLFIDEAEAGTTFDCPVCGKPVFVPPSSSRKPLDAPTRVEVKSTSRKAVSTNPSVPLSSSRTEPEVLKGSTRQNRSSTAKAGGKVHGGKGGLNMGWVAKNELCGPWPKGCEKGHTLWVDGEKAVRDVQYICPIQGGRIRVKAEDIAWARSSVRPKGAIAAYRI